MTPPPELGPSKFQERPFGAMECKKAFLAARAPPRTQLGELPALPEPRSWWGGGWLPLFKDPTPAALPLIRNRRLGSFQHDKKVCKYN